MNTIYILHVRQVNYFDPQFEHNLNILSLFNGFDQS